MCRACQASNESVACEDDEFVRFWVANRAGWDDSLYDDGSPTGCVTPAAVLVLGLVGAAEFAAVWGAWVFLF